MKHHVTFCQASSRQHTNKLAKVVLCLVLIWGSAVHAAESNITVLAAASLSDVMTQLAQQYTKQTGIQIATVYGGSGTLAKQIEQGAPADIFISADEQWMQYLQQQQLLKPHTIKPWLSNRLVMIAPSTKPRQIQIKPMVNISQQVGGYWCTGDTLSVPVGIYAKQALIHLGWWQHIKAKLVSTSDVRVALRLVEREECDIGIVYASDLLVSNKVVLVAEFPEKTYQPIVYPIVMLPRAGSDAADFYRFLLSDKAKKVLKQYGFKP